MAEQKIFKNDIVSVFKRLRSIPANKVCFDCGAKNPTWASVTYGVFICMDCSAVHRSLGVHLSFVRSTQLDTNWTWLQLRAMQVGGNTNAVSFFQQHGCTSTDAQQKYNSRAAQLYREKLHQQAAAAIRLHGTKLHIEVPHAEPPQSPEHKDHDFFKDITESDLTSRDPLTNEEGLQNKSIGTVRNLNILQNNNKGENDITVNLESSLHIRPDVQAKPDTRKSAIVGRKPAANKKMMAGRKGLGAQKVAANFNDIEKEAQRVDNMQLQPNSENKTPSKMSAEEGEKQKASIRLAYHNISLRQKETEEKLRLTDPRKAEQLERLGMGFGSRSNTSGVGHSAASEMKLITQETATPPSKSHELDLDDDFEFFSFTSGPPKYGDSPFLTRSASDHLSDLSGENSWSHEKNEKKVPAGISPSPQKDTRSHSRKAVPITTTDEAQKKFGNVKAISSEQYFGSSRDTEFERRTNLTRFEGSSSISSEDFFGGDGPSTRNSSSSAFSSSNLYEIKEGVRDGVTKVAGRLSSIANGVMNTLQRK